MAIDLTGGMSEEMEYFFAEKPGPKVRDATNIWLEEQNGEFGMRVFVEAVAESWDSHMLQLDIAFANGRVLHLRDFKKPHSPIGPGGKPTVLGSGPMRFECLAPFERWNVRFGPYPVPDRTAQELIDNDLSGTKTSEVSFDIDFLPAVPPMISGTLTAASRELMRGEQGAFISPRFEQLCRAEGWLEIDGERRQFKGQVLRIKRQGVRVSEGFLGHCWQSALFPSGKAFGVNIFPPRDDGMPNFNEGFVFDGDGPLRPAKAVEVPWMRRFEVSGEAVPLVLETEDGERVAIDGMTFINCRSVGVDSVTPAKFPLVQQAHAMYRWGDEQAAGTIERSTFREYMKF